MVDCIPVSGNVQVYSYKYTRTLQQINIFIIIIITTTTTTTIMYPLLIKLIAIAISDYHLGKSQCSNKYLHF